MNIKCNKCDCEFTDQPNNSPAKVYVHKGEMVCEHCLMDMGVSPDTANPQETYLYTRDDLYRVL